MQKELFGKIVWLSPKKLYMYMSEKQPRAFPSLKTWMCKRRLTGADLVRRVRSRHLRTMLSREGFFRCSHWRSWRANALARAGHPQGLPPPKLEYLEVLVFSASGFNAGGSGLKVIRIYQREFLQDLWNSAHA